MALRAGLFLGFLFIWLVVMLPLKAVMILAGGAHVFGYQDVYGTVWSGRVYGMRLNGQPVSEVMLSLDPLPLVTGRLSAQWRVSDASLRGAGHSSWGGETITARNVALDVSLDRLGLSDIPGFTGNEMVRISVLELDLRGDTCRQAAGDVRSEALVELAESYGFTGPVLEGILTCIDNRLALDVSGQSDVLSLSGRVYFTAAGYEWAIEAETQQGDLADALAVLGLERDGEVWRHEGRRAYAGE